MMMNTRLKRLDRWIFTLVCCGFLASAHAQQANDFVDYEAKIPGTKVTFKMVAIQGGEFLMGSPETEKHRKPDEGPQVKVKIEPFWMGAYEVSYQEYELFRDKDKEMALATSEDGVKLAAVTRPSPPYEDPTFGMGKYDYPAASMTQYAAISYCKWLYEKTGVFYRLPTEAEWEYACRAGSQTAYPFGDDPAQLGEYAWYYENSADAYQKRGTKKPNAWGLYDMLGNVAEWTIDQYQADYYAKLGKEAASPWSKPTSLHPRVVRGGTYLDDPDKLRSASRTESDLKWKRRDPQIPKSFWWNTDSPFVGFRLVRPLNQPSPSEIARFWSLNLDE
jgi:formylglycine-generating enzyme required for sulfatase activity